MTRRAPTDLDLVEETVCLPGRALSVLRPRSADELLDEDAFEHEEFLPYWAELWPSGVALARVLWRRRLRGVRVLELGCGLAVPSIAAALRGARVLATDWSPDAVELARENAARNGAQLETALVSWGEPGALAGRAPWPLVLAADVLYERRNGELLLDLLPAVTAPGGQLLLADPGRPFTSAFLERAGAEWAVAPVDAGTPRVAVHSLRRGRRRSHEDDVQLSPVCDVMRARP